MNENSIGYLIRHYRTLRAVTQRELAQTVGVHVITVSLWESNKKSPSFTNLRKIADALKVELDEFTRYLEK